MTELVMLSGGHDSVAASWAVAQRRPVLLVHQRQALLPRRRRAEARAARAAAGSIAAHAPFSVAYRELGCWLPLQLALPHHDMIRLAAPRAAMLAALPELDRAATCANATDVEDGWLDRFAAYRDLTARALAGIRPAPEWTAPLGWPAPAKEEIGMPEPLAALTFSCFTPEPGLRPCGRCRKCRGDVLGVVDTATTIEVADKGWSVWRRIVWADAGRLPRMACRARSTLVLAPHPDPPVLARLRCQAEALSRKWAAPVVVRPFWLPGLDRLPRRPFLRARKAAVRVLAELVAPCSSTVPDDP